MYIAILSVARSPVLADFFQASIFSLQYPWFFQSATPIVLICLYVYHHHSMRKSNDFICMYDGQAKWLTVLLKLFTFSSVLVFSVFAIMSNRHRANGPDSNGQKYIDSIGIKFSLVLRSLAQTKCSYCIFWTTFLFLCLNHKDAKAAKFL